jgi:hypothetical protein
MDNWTKWRMGYFDIGICMPLKEPVDKTRMIVVLGTLSHAMSHIATCLIMTYKNR